MFREVKDVFTHKFLPKQPEKIEFELKEDESDSTTKEDSEEEEPQTPAVRRSGKKTTRKVYSICFLFKFFFNYH